MATQNEPCLLFCGYRSMSNVDEYFKRSSLVCSAHLYVTNHCVREEINRVVGKCVAQVKSVEYDVCLDVSTLLLCYAFQLLL